MKSRLLLFFLLLIIFINACNEDDPTSLTSTPPCLSANNCKQTLGILSTDTEDLAIEYFSSFEIERADVTWENLKAAIIVIHGNNRNADEYFDWMVNMVASIEKAEEVIIIAPHFKTASDIGGNNELIYWTSDGWKRGFLSLNTASEDFSSYEVLDAFIDILTNKNRFPVLTDIIIAGHSSGGQFTQLYATANKVDNTGQTVNFNYISANSQYYFYPGNERYNSNINQFEIPQNCGNYNVWPYGANNLPPYDFGLAATDINSRFTQRNITYLLGTNDINTGGTFNNVDCKATLLGNNRFDRGEKMFDYMETFHTGNHTHQKVLVDNVGHNPNTMFNSSASKDLFLNLLEE